MAEPVGHGRWPPAAPLFGAEIKRQPLDDGGEIGPERAAVLKFAQDGVIVVDEPEPHEAGKVVLFSSRQVSPPADRPYDLIDQIKMVEEQLLIIHVEFVGKTRLSVRARRNTSEMTRTVIPCVVQSEKLPARVRLYIREPGSS